MTSLGNCQEVLGIVPVPWRSAHLEARCYAHLGVVGRRAELVPEGSGELQLSSVANGTPFEQLLQRTNLLKAGSQVPPPLHRAEELTSSTVEVLGFLRPVVLTFPDFLHARKV
ncbi:hypothetical protein P8C59_007915 [Phyllachora maydis]|uniref:Uncharacterized protein n=1 Tax=Phyllachora maydis TaxID=1825666 RepID=A0AAD9ME13_9PEZI|nr:hypothetical protein P8C59_007915 [Phyllachora maydis]